MTRVAVVVNPSKTRAKGVADRVAQGCAERGWPEPEVLETAVDSTGRDQAAAAARAGAELVLACGGDGTVRAVAHGLAGTGAAMALVPVGTANLLAHNLGLATRDTGRAVDTALDGRRRPLDLGLARLGEDGSEHPFVVLAGIGHDAATVADTRDDLKHRIGWPAYVTPAARHALRRPVPVRVRLDDGPAREVVAWSVLAASCGRVRAGVQIAPGALLDDGLLDVLEVTVARPVGWLPVAAKGVLGLRRDVPGLRTRRAAELEVTADQPLHVQLDGDIMGRVDRLRVRVERRAVDVVEGAR